MKLRALLPRSFMTPSPSQDGFPAENGGAQTSDRAGLLAIPRNLLLGSRMLSRSFSLGSSAGSSNTGQQSQQQQQQQQPQSMMGGAEPSRQPGISYEILLATLSFEVRTVLNNVVGCSDLLAAHATQLPPELRDANTAVTVSSRQLLKVVDQIRLLANLDERDLEVTLAPVNLFRVLNLAIGRFTRISQMYAVNIKIINELQHNWYVTDDRSIGVMLDSVVEVATYNAPAGATITLIFESQPWVSDAPAARASSARAASSDGSTPNSTAAQTIQFTVTSDCKWKRTPTTLLAALGRMVAPPKEQSASSARGLSREQIMLGVTEKLAALLGGGLAVVGEQGMGLMVTLGAVAVNPGPNAQQLPPPLPSPTLSAAPPVPTPAINLGLSASVGSSSNGSARLPAPIFETRSPQVARTRPPSPLPLSSSLSSSTGATRQTPARTSPLAFEVGANNIDSMVASEYDATRRDRIETDVLMAMVAAMASPGTFAPPTTNSDGGAKLSDSKGTGSAGAADVAMAARTVTASTAPPPPSDVQIWRYPPDDALLPARDAGMRKVLFVEGDLTNQRVIQSMFKLLGIVNVIFASDGADALFHFNTIRGACASEFSADYFDLIFLDHSLPTLSGEDVSVRMRTLDRSQVLISCSAAVDLIADPTKCQALGYDEAITKPLYVDAMRGFLERWVAGGDRRRLRHLKRKLKREAIAAGLQVVEDI
ncbi:hypothetical protein BC828DRAFT_396046 [Blastocladiella britannica]|nr:hypothetical protein BC828DRAFT_396046 [Blastocladiella britannica]